MAPFPDMNHEFHKRDIHRIQRVLQDLPRQLNLQQGRNSADIVSKHWGLLNYFLYVTKNVGPIEERKKGERERDIQYDSVTFQ